METKVLRGSQALLARSVLMENVVLSGLMGQSVYLVKQGQQVRKEFVAQMEYLVLQGRKVPKDLMVPTESLA